MDDNLYPNDGQWFGMTVPIEQETADDKQKAEVFSDAPFIQAILDHLSVRIAFYSSVDSLDELDDPVKHMHQVVGNKVALDALRAEKEALELLVKQYK